VDAPRAVTSAADLSSALSNAKELLLLTYWNGNIEVSEFSDGKIKYFDRKGDADFAQKLRAFLMAHTGKDWTLEKLQQSESTPTNGEIKKAEIESDPAVANALDLFAGAEIVSVK
jgi:hypothetical protein